MSSGGLPTVRIKPAGSLAAEISVEEKAFPNTSFNAWWRNNCYS